MKKMMRYNNYKKDSFTTGSPFRTISAIGDLINSCSGAYDAKISSVKEIKGKKFKKFSLLMDPLLSKIFKFLIGIILQVKNVNNKKEKVYLIK